MAGERVERRLAAILAADVVGYSRQMDGDETGTLTRLKALREGIFDPTTARFGGRIFKNTGDGALAEFPSAVDAVQCAIDVQRALAERNATVAPEQRITLRIGISLGDVIVEGDDLYGNGVNVAARLEAMAPAGGVCVSGNVQEHVRSTAEIDFEDMGEQSVKNIDRPVHAFRINLGEEEVPGDAAPDDRALPGAASAPAAGGAPAGETEALFRRPSIAVLPFDNLSHDPDQEFFADGLTEDIITLLSLWRAFPVIARNSTFAYKGKSPDIRQVGRELGALYVVEGSVRKAGNRVRVTAQLINAETGHHVWAEKYDRELEDIFAVQDEITHRIAAIIQPTLDQAEQERIASSAVESLDAWGYYQRGMSLVHRFTKESLAQAREMFARALELDPTYARAAAAMAYSYSADLLMGYAEAGEAAAASLMESAKRAAALDDTDSFAQFVLGIAYPWTGELDLAILSLERAVQINPSNVGALGSLGNLLDLVGRTEEGIARMEQAITLNPRDPHMVIATTFLARAQMNARRYDEAVASAQKAIQGRPDYVNARYIQAVALGHLGRAEEARAALDEIERTSPGFLKGRAEWRPYRDAESNAHILDGLRKAGWEG